MILSLYSAPVIVLGLVLGFPVQEIQGQKGLEHLLFMRRLRRGTLHPQKKDQGDLNVYQHLMGVGLRE